MWGLKTAFLAGLGSAQYADPMGATHDDVAPDYIKTFTDASTDSCMQQCLDLQAMTTTPHHSNIFCHQASDYGWEPNKPTWEVLMEVRCQIGIWKNYPDNYVPHYGQKYGKRKRRSFHEFFPSSSSSSSGSSSQSSSSGNNNSGNSGNFVWDGGNGEEAHSNRDLSWQHKPRWFYCNEGSWINKEKTLYELENSFAIKDDMAECTHLHGPFDFNDGCNIEKYDWFPGWYECEYQPYPSSHQYYNAAVHGSYNRGEGEAVRSEEEARSIWGTDAGYLKVCKVQCPAPSVPREILADGSVATITCDLRTGEWSPAPPQGCDEPFGRGHQCANPQSQSSNQFTWHGRWECEGPHGHTYEPKPSYSGYNPGYQPGYNPSYPSSYNGGYDPYGRRRRDAEHSEGEGEDGERGYYGSPSYPAPSYPSSSYPSSSYPSSSYSAPSYPSSGYPSNYPAPSYSGSPYASNYQHYSAYSYSPPKKTYSKTGPYGYGYDASIHGQTHCHLTCDPGFVSSTCDTELTCDPTTWPSWGPDINPPVCVPREMKACPRDCDFEPSVVENGMYLCTRLPGAWKTECVLQCQEGLNHRGLSYVVDDTDMSILTCNSDDKWLNALGANGTVTHCVEAASKCPTSAAEVDALFDAGTGGSFDTNINGGIVDVTLKCEQGHRPEVFSKTTTRCYDGNWLSDITRCIEDKDYCLDGHPQLTTNTTDINGQWECTRTSVTGIEVVYSQDQRTELFDEAERSYGYDTNYNGYNQDHILSAQAKWTCRLICDQGFMVSYDSVTTCTDYIGTSWDLSPFPVCEAKPVCDVPSEDVCTDWDCSKQFYNQNAIQGTYANSQYSYHNYGYMPAKNSYWPEKFYASSPNYQQYYKPNAYGYVAGYQHPYHHLYSNIDYNAGSMYYSNVYKKYNSYSSSSTTYTTTQNHYVGRRSVDDDPMDRWEWDDDIQEVQRCVPLCKDNCISVSGITAYHCFVETATWDAAPVRCCPDVHAIENPDETCAIDLETTEGTAWDMKVAPSWTTGADSTMDVTDDAEKLTAGSYTCTSLTDVSVRYEVVAGNGGMNSYGHEPYNYNQYKYKQYWDGYYCSYPESYDSYENIPYGRKRRSLHTFGLPSGSSSSGSSSSSSQPAQSSSSSSSFTPSQTTSGSSSGWATGQPAYYGPAPSHPDCVVIKEKLCTLTCPDGEVPALGHDTSVCHEYANGSQKWVKKLTHCVNSADIMAVLVDPPAEPANTGLETWAPSKEAAAAPSSPQKNTNLSPKEIKKAQKAAKKAAKKKKKAEKKAKKKAAKNKKKKDRDSKRKNRSEMKFQMRVRKQNSRLNARALRRNPELNFGY